MRERERGASRAPGDLQPLPRSQSVASWAVRGPAAAAPVTSPHSGCSPGPLAAVSSALHTRLTPSLSLHQPLLTATSLPCPRGGPSRSISIWRKELREGPWGSRLPGQAGSVSTWSSTYAQPGLPAGVRSPELGCRQCQVSHRSDGPSVMGSSGEPSPFSRPAALQPLLPALGQ